MLSIHTHTQQQTSRDNMRLGRTVRRILFYIVVTLGALVMIMPFLYMVGISFTPGAFILQTPPKFIPDHPTFDNYLQAWNFGNFGQAFGNSVIVAISSTAIHTLLASMLAFAFARYSFPGRNLMFYGMIATMSVPGIVLLIPQFVLASRLGITNSLQGLIVVYSAGLAFNVFLLRGFFEDIPQELFDSAALDGSGVFRSFFTIALPLAKPALATIIIFSFGGYWDEFIWALTSTNDPSLYTLPVALQQFYVAHGTNWGVVFAGSVIAALPIIVIFLLFQRYYMTGLSGALKG